MKKKINKQVLIIDCVIVIVAITQFIQWLVDFFYVAMSLLASLTYMLCYRLARKNIETNWRYYMWMWVPTFLVIICPFIYSLFTNTSDLLLNIILTLPIFSLLLPIGLLLWLRVVAKRQTN